MAISTLVVSINEGLGRAACYTGVLVDVVVAENRAVEPKAAVRAEALAVDADSIIVAIIRARFGDLTIGGDRSGAGKRTRITAGRWEGLSLVGDRTGEDVGADGDHESGAVRAALSLVAAGVLKGALRINKRGGVKLRSDIIT